MPRRLKLLLKLGLLLAFMGVSGVAGVLAYYNRDLPDYRQLAEYQPSTMTRLYAADGTLLSEYATEKRIFVPLSSIPMAVRAAFLTAEDRNFYNHPGIDARGILRALLHNTMGQDRMQGASTITQQVAKNMLLSQERSFSRKVREVLLAVKISHAYSKNRMLELYLNEIYLGAQAYGVAAAALHYFNKPLPELSLEEAALLAAMPKAPSAFNPWKNEPRALSRRNWILAAMAEEGYITKAEAEAATAIPIRLQAYAPTIARADSFAEEVRQRLVKEYGENTVYSGGLTVHTTLDPRLQAIAEKALKHGLMDYTQRHDPERAPEEPEVNGAIVAMDPHTGKVLALVGGFSFEESTFNRATQAKRQPGSVFKPFVYLAALENGYTPASRIREEETSFSMGKDEAEKWSPGNSSGKLHGLTTLRAGLEASLNVLTVQLASELGMDKILASVSRYNIAPSFPRELGTVLGTTETDLLSITSAYAVLANGGFEVSPRLVDYIEDRNGIVITQDEHYTCIGCENTRAGKTPHITGSRKRLVDAASDYQIVSMLEGVVQRGTGVGAKVLGRPVAGKTGTTNDSRDAWFIGFTPELVVGVYTGYDTPRSLGEKEQGATVALPIFVEFMQEALAGVLPKEFPVPEGITLVKVDAKTGGLPTKDTPRYEIITEAFRTGTEPTISFARELSPSPAAAAKIEAVPASMKHEPPKPTEGVLRSMGRR